jgi:hypothetical protein
VVPRDERHPVNVVISLTKGFLGGGGWSVVQALDCGALGNRRKTRSPRRSALPPDSEKSRRKSIEGAQAPLRRLKMVPFDSAMNAFLGAVNTFTSAVDGTTAAVNAFMGAVNAFMTAMNAFTSAMNAFLGAVSTFTSAVDGTTAAVNAFMSAVSAFMTAMNVFTSAMDVDG